MFFKQTWSLSTVTKFFKNVFRFLVSYLSQKLTGHYWSTRGAWPSDKVIPLCSTGEVMCATLHLLLEPPDQAGWWETRKTTGEGPGQQDLWQEGRESGLFSLAKEQGNLTAAYSYPECKWQRWGTQTLQKRQRIQGTMATNCTLRGQGTAGRG